MILGLGVATDAWHGVNGWFEAGESLRYSPTRANPGRLVPDYRGGVVLRKGTGANCWRAARTDCSPRPMMTAFTSAVRQRQLLYSQNRTGCTLRASRTSGFHAQVYWNWNPTVDAPGQYWANYVETGPGVRFRFEGAAACRCSFR